MCTLSPTPGTLSATPANASESRRYHRWVRRLGVADVVLGVLLLALVLAAGWSRNYRDFAFRLAGDRPALALFYYTTILLLLTRVVSLGVDYALFLVEHRYHLSRQRLRGWMWDQAKGFLLVFVVSQALVQVVYLLIRWMPHWWWVAGWLLFMLLTVVVAHVAPVVFFPIFFRFRALDDVDLTERLTRMGEKAGARIRGVYEWTLSDRTRKANAALIGLGKTRRIVLSDTLLATCTPDEIEAILAHEVGHHSSHHLLKAICFQGAVAFFGFWSVKLAIRWAEFDWQHPLAQIDFANLPLMILVATAVSVAMVPVMNAYSRFNERRADVYAWKTQGTVEPFCSALEKLAAQNLSEQEPSRLVVWLFHSHPPIGSRLRAARAWQAARQQNPR